MDNAALRCTVSFGSTAPLSEKNDQRSLIAFIDSAPNITQLELWLPLEKRSATDWFVHMLESLVTHTDLRRFVLNQSGAQTFDLKAEVEKPQVQHLLEHWCFEELQPDKLCAVRSEGED